ncbi:glycoside hydrolase family 10 protein [Synechococcus sp. PCC 7336]|uniref:glycoside hydrolase family 10 protein n=1 Tax=Synechococcus sp. PCC 7336 TaxID=195250 RepID=UPI00138AB15D|nr:family 10 glycosylhydrolase [Synechococcus sp. PCC 7336]
MSSLIESRARSFLKGILGAACLLSVAATSAFARPIVTVVHEINDERDWSSIENLLEQSSIEYRILAEEQLTLEVLRQVDVLFLPNLSDLSDAQLQALETWMRADGGRAIASGPMAGLSPENRRRLQQLLGGYWADDRAVSAPVVATSYPGNDWTDSIRDRTPLQGGSLIPSGIFSRLTATWTGDVGSPVAVLSTLQSVYLGWEWGSQADAAETDLQWLIAALDRFDPSSNLTALRNNSTPPATPSSGPNRAATVLVAPPASPSRLNLLPEPIPPSTSAPDPAALAEPESYVSPLPINTLEMLSMRQELGSLLGRVESAILTTDANSLDGNGLPPQYQAVIGQARQVYEELPDWVSSGQHQRARREFRQAIDTLWTNYPRDRLTALPEVRAIWLDRGTIVKAASPEGLAQVFNRLADAGINTVFFETINAGFTVYPSRIAPAQNPLTRHWDPLAAAVQLARDRDIELHAWMWTFAVGNTRHNDLPRINLPHNYVGPVLSAHPDWSNFDWRGRQFPSGQPETWLDPANPQVRNYLISLMREMVTDYGVDGIHLDYIRYPFQNPGSRATFGYGRAARQQFQQLTGVDPMGLDPNRDRSLWTLWTDFRAEQVSNFVAEAAASVRALDSQVVMSAAVYAFPPNERRQRLQQEWETWIGRGDIDLLVPLTYVDNTRSLEQLVRPTLALTNESPVLLLPSLNLIGLPEVEFLDKMQAVRDLPTGGYSLFAAEHLNDTFQDILHQSRIPSSQIPYRAPFSASAFRFAALRQEWETLLANEQMWIPERFLGDWQAQVEQAAAALQALEQSPSETTLLQARAEIATLREGLEDWFRFEALERPYRVETWENRIIALDTLLRYGERRLPSLQSVSSSR